MKNSVSRPDTTLGAAKTHTLFPLTGLTTRRGTKLAISKRSLSARTHRNKTARNSSHTTEDFAKKRKPATNTTPTKSRDNKLQLKRQAARSRKGPGREIDLFVTSNTNMRAVF